MFKLPKTLCATLTLQKKKKRKVREISPLGILGKRSLHVSFSHNILGRVDVSQPLCFKIHTHVSSSVSLKESELTFLFLFFLICHAQMFNRVHVSGTARNETPSPSQSPHTHTYANTHTHGLRYLSEAERGEAGDPFFFLCASESWTVISGAECVGGSGGNP